MGDHYDDSSDGGEEPKLIEPGPDKMSRSVTWSVFLVYDPEHHKDKSDKAICKLCGAEIVWGGKISHLKHMHPEEYKELRKNEPVDKRFEVIANPTLIEPNLNLRRKRTKYGPFWSHFSLYDLEVHPHKTEVARCNLCAKDISIRNLGTRLHSHLAAWHEAEFLELGGEYDDNMKPVTPKRRCYGNGSGNKDEDDEEDGDEKSDAEEDYDLLEPGDRKKSKYWRHYKLYDPVKHPDRKNLVRCNICGENVKKYNIALMSGHLEENHPEEFEELADIPEDNLNCVPGPDDPRFKYIPDAKMIKPNIKPWSSSKYSKYWCHFMLYDPDAHPEKETVARCNLCNKDISILHRGTALHAHLGRWHEKEYLELSGEYDSRGKPIKPTEHTGLSYWESRSKRLKTSNGDDDPNKPSNNQETEETGGNSVEDKRRSQEKFWMEMWKDTRMELRKLRKELKGEEDDDLREELNIDIQKLMTRKADYESRLGMIN